MHEKHLFTSESVTEGHPDKMADQISDSVLDAIFEQDPMARVACETFLTTGLALVGGEITTNCYVPIDEIVRNTIKEIGYIDADFGIDGRNCSVITTIGKQSPDIAMGVDEGNNKAQGAGDQGMMFGYACDETPELMPLPISLAHKLAERLALVRKGFNGNAPINWLRPDGKTQVTVEYDDDKPIRIDTVLISTQHSEKVSQEEIKKTLLEQVVKPILPANFVDDNTKFLANPTGRFVIGGPHADAGLTGRKIIVDTYGGRGSHGGGAFSGKDPSKVDRSAAYMARYIAKNIVAAGLAKQCQIQLAYAIGVAEPVSIRVNTFGKSKYAEHVLVNAVRKTFPLTPAGIIEHLDLRRPIYKKTAAYGHFGRELPEFIWESTKLVDELLKHV